MSAIAATLSARAPMYVSLPSGSRLSRSAQFVHGEVSLAVAQVGISAEGIRVGSRQIGEEPANTVPVGQLRNRSRGGVCEWRVIRGKERWIPERSDLARRQDDGPRRVCPTFHEDATLRIPGNPEANGVA